MGLGHHFSRVSHAAGPVAAARGPFRAPGCARLSKRGSAVEASGRRNGAASR
jgi:hypothetical protein